MFSPHTSLFSKYPKSAGHQDNKRKKGLKKVKSSILKYMISLSVICLIIVLERVFYDFLITPENDLILFLQEKMGIYKKSSNFFYVMIGSMSDTRFFFLLNTHIYITIFFGVNSFRAIKILIVHNFGLFCCYLLQLLYQTPRPFWSDDRIIALACDGDFMSPNDCAFSFIFIFYYIMFNFRDRRKQQPPLNRDSNEIGENNVELVFKEDELSILDAIHTNSVSSSVLGSRIEQKITFGKKIMKNWLLILKIVYIMLFFIIFFIREALGTSFWESIFITMVYCVFYFYICLFLDVYIDGYIKRTTVIYTEAKRYVFKWFIYIILLELLAYVIFACNKQYVPVEWIQNYVKSLFFK